MPTANAAGPSNSRPNSPPEERSRERATDWRKLSLPIHHLESICVFGPSTITPPALDLCWEHGVAVNFLSQFGHLQARLTGVADTSLTPRRPRATVAAGIGSAESLWLRSARARATLNGR